jgi:hypothetical protein
MRCGTSGASGHVTTKPSIGNRDVLYKSGVYARKALCLTPGGLSCAPPVGGAEGRAIDPDRMGEVSRGHTRRNETDRRGSLHGRTRNPPCISKEQVAETLGLNGKSLRLCRL